MLHFPTSIKVIGWMWFHWWVAGSSFFLEYGNFYKDKESYGILYVLNEQGKHPFRKWWLTAALEQDQEPAHPPKWIELVQEYRKYSKPYSRTKRSDQVWVAQNRKKNRFRLSSRLNQKSTGWDIWWLFPFSPYTHSEPHSALWGSLEEPIWDHIGKQKSGSLLDLQPERDLETELIDFVPCCDIHGHVSPKEGDYEAGPASDLDSLSAHLIKKQRDLPSEDFQADWHTEEIVQPRRDSRYGKRNCLSTVI